MPTSTSGQPSQAHTHPYRTLLASFAAWKLFLFAIALGSSLVGDAYDTSASLVVEVVGNSTKSSNDGPSLTGSFGSRFISRLTSWDAIYFTSVARRGYRFEQEWAFGGALPVVVRGVIKGEPNILVGRMPSSVSVPASFLLLEMFHPSQIYPRL